MDVTFTVSIDWDNDDDWDEGYEDVSQYVKSANWSLGMSKPGYIVMESLFSTGES